jgi:predicted dienelactone hydrolase
MLFLLACSTAEKSPDPDLVTQAAERGLHAVGHAEATVATADPLGEPRELRTSVWYPTTDTDGDDAAYFLGSLSSSGAFEDATPATGPFPLVVFSHGHQGYAENSAFLMEHLASHGWMVVAPDHTGNTLLDGGERDTAIYLQRPRDLTAVMDALAAGELPGPEWDGTAVAMGHSFGGYTVFVLGGATWDVAAMNATCDAGAGGDECSDWSWEWEARFAEGAADARVVGTLAMAPGDYAKLGDDGVAATGPAMLMTGELDPERDADGALYAGVLTGRGDRHLDILGAGHQSFTDFAGQLDDGSTIAPEDGWRVVDAYALAFAQHAIGDATYDGILDGSLVVDEAAVLY